MRNAVAVLTRRRLLQFAGGGALGLNLGGLWREEWGHSRIGRKRISNISISFDFLPLFLQEIFAE